KLHAGDGPAGMLVEDALVETPAGKAGTPAATRVAANAEVSPFRRDLPMVSSSQSIWPWVIVAASCVFFGDVFVRRVQVDLSWLWPILGRWRDKILRRER